MSELLEWASFLFWAVLFLNFMATLFGTIRIVPQRSALIVERLGRFPKVLKSGIHFLLPYIDQVPQKFDLKEESIEVPPQECFTKDEVRVLIDCLIYISVADPEKACYGVEDYRTAAIQLAQTTTQAAIAKLDLDQTAEERDLISRRVVEVLSQTANQWGIQVHRYEVKGITPPKSVKLSMEKQVTAERDRKAVLAQSEGEKQALINRSEGYKAEMINTSEGEKQKRINEAEGHAAEIRSRSGCDGDFDRKSGFFA